MPNKELALSADVALRSIHDPEKRSAYHISHDYIKAGEIFNRVSGTVAYVGSGQELSSFFLFLNASIFVHQDGDYDKLHLPMLVLQESGVISDYSFNRRERGKREHNFKLGGKKKKLIEVQMNVEEGVPDEAKINLEAIYFFGVPYPRVIRELQRKLLPHLRMGGLFEGPYPYSNGEFEGSEPHQLGLERSGPTYIKVRQVSYKEIVGLHRRNPSKYFPGW